MSQKYPMWLQGEKPPDDVFSSVLFMMEMIGVASHLPEPLRTMQCIEKAAHKQIKEFEYKPGGFHIDFDSPQYDEAIALCIQNIIYWMSRGWITINFPPPPSNPRMFVF